MDRGFSLIEVMVAMAIFAVFVVAFVQTQGTQVNISASFPDNLNLRARAQTVMDDLIVNPPSLDESLFLGSADERTFEDDENYSYKVQWQAFELPDLSKLKDAEEEDPVEQLIITNVAENLKKLLFQVEVTVTHKKTQNTYTLSTWIENQQVAPSIVGL